MCGSYFCWVWASGQTGVCSHHHCQYFVTPLSPGLHSLGQKSADILSSLLCRCLSSRQTLGFFLLDFFSLSLAFRGSFELDVSMWLFIGCCCHFGFCPVWGSLTSWICNLISHYFWKIFSHYLFTYFFAPFLLLLLGLRLQVGVDIIDSVINSPQGCSVFFSLCFCLGNFY